MSSYFEEHAADQVNGFAEAVELWCLERFGSDPCPATDERIAERARIMDRRRSELIAVVAKVKATEKALATVNKELEAYKTIVPWVTSAETAS